MQYDKEILRVLAEAGNEGLSVQKVSRHVFNACNSLFNSSKSRRRTQVCTDVSLEE